MGEPKLISIRKLLPLEDISSIEYSDSLMETHHLISTVMGISDKMEWVVSTNFIDLISVLESRDAKRRDDYFIFSHLDSGLRYISVLGKKEFLSDEDIVNE